MSAEREGRAYAHIKAAQGQREGEHARRKQKAEGLCFPVTPVPDAEAQQENKCRRVRQRAVQPFLRQAVKHGNRNREGGQHKACPLPARIHHTAGVKRQKRNLIKKDRQGIGHHRPEGRGRMEQCAARADDDNKSDQDNGLYV